MCKSFIHVFLFVIVSDKSLKVTLDKVLQSGYFDRAQTHQNGTCEENGEQEKQTVGAESDAGDQPSEPGKFSNNMFNKCVSLTKK